jgi:hypothetical protein
MSFVYVTVWKDCFNYKRVKICLDAVTGFWDLKNLIVRIFNVKPCGHYYLMLFGHRVKFQMEWLGEEDLLSQLDDQIESLELEYYVDDNGDDFRDEDEEDARGFEQFRNHCRKMPRNIFVGDYFQEPLHRTYQIEDDD